jgi:tetratricopeptide (TPR) repeat protein
MNGQAMRSVVCTLTIRTMALAAVCAGLLGLAFAPQSTWAQDSGPSQQEKAMHYSLYYENFKNDNFKSARKDLMWVLDNAPGFPKTDQRNYKRAVELYLGLAEQAENDKKRSAYLDTAATYLTTSIEKMEAKGLEYDKYEWELEKGRFMEQFGTALPNDVEGLQSAVAHYRKAFDLAPTEINAYYIDQTVQAHLDNNETQKALEFVNLVEEKRPDDREVQKIIGEARQEIFGKNPQARINHLKKQLEQNPKDAALMQELFDAYTNRGNVEAASKLADRLMASNPPAEVVRDIAKMRLDDGRPQEAFETYQQAVEQGAELTAQDYFNMGLAKNRTGDLAQAREQFRKAIEMNPDYGQAYIAIGDVYAKAVSECGGSKMGRRDKAVYWAAVDMYRKAKQVDSSIASTADSKINTYRKYFPSNEDIFFIDEWEKGSSVRIDYGCYSWIGETTTVRSSS